MRDRGFRLLRAAFIAGAGTEIVGGFAGWVAAPRVVPTLVLQTLLLTLFGVAYVASPPRGIHK